MQLAGEVIREQHDDSGIACHEVLYTSGTRAPKHAHESPFFALAIDGAFVESVGEQIFQGTSRSVIYHAAGEEHTVAIGRRNLRCFVIEMDADAIAQRYAIALPGSTLHATGGPLSSLLTSAYHEFRHPDPCSWLSIEGLLLQVLVTASRATLESGRPLWLHRVTDFLHARFRDRITLAEIAAEVGVPAPRLSAVFRAVHRRSLAEEQRRLRIEFACDRLAHADVSLADVALEAGFADQPHFTRTFKTVVGMTPAQFRAVLRGNGGRPPVRPSSPDATTSCGCS
jgi:AraC family transcriptional regulator